MLAAGVLVLSGSVGVLAGRHLFGERPVGLDSSALTERVRALEEEIRAKDEALAAAREARSKTGPTPPTLVSVPRPKRSGSEPIVEQPAMPSDPEFGEPHPRSSGEKPHLNRGGAPLGARSAVQPPEVLHPEQGASGVPRQAQIKIRAEEVTATEEAPNHGKLSFRLVKDMAETSFGGYLFVYVETQAKKGEDKVVVYPEKVSLIPGDLMPLDHKDGISVMFNKSRLFTFEYEDKRRGASLSGATILLYNEDGTIRFQRGFDRSELRIEKAKEKRPKSSGSPAGQKPRQAL